MVCGPRICFDIISPGLSSSRRDLSVKSGISFHSHPLPAREGRRLILYSLALWEDKERDMNKL